MAKKIAKKTAAGKTSAKKSPASKKTAAASRRTSASAGRPAARKSAAKKTATKAPARVSTGKGPSAAEIGKDFVTRVNLGQFEEIYGAWYHPTKVESIEGDGQVWRGMKGIRAKNVWWGDNHEVHSCTAEGPYVGASGFSVKYSMSFTPKGGERVEMTEVAVHTVKDGKIVREEYMYGG